MAVDPPHSQKRPLKNLCGAAIAACIALVSPVLWALPGDRNQPIEIEANEALRDESRGLTVYEGDVTIRQGTIAIGADKVNVLSEGSKVSTIVCIGKPATYRQQPKEDDGPVVAQAKTITYNLDSDTIFLEGDASLEQAEATLTGQRIEYNLARETIRANGGGDKGERIRMVIPPKQLEGE